MNRQYLSHDYATDVISFGYQADPPRLAGEMVISAETARQRAAEIGWSATHEMMLYVIHGTLHITGMDDGDRDQRAAMRAAEREVMHRLGVAQIDAHGADCGLSAPRRAEEHA